MFGFKGTVWQYHWGYYVQATRELELGIVTIIMTTAYEALNASRCVYPQLFTFHSIRKGEVLVIPGIQSRKRTQFDDGWWSPRLNLRLLTCHTVKPENSWTAQPKTANRCVSTFAQSGSSFLETRDTRCVYWGVRRRDSVTVTAMPAQRL